jgi:hypothetical protein
VLREMTNRGLSGLVSPGHWHHALANAGKGPAGVVVVQVASVGECDIVCVECLIGKQKKPILFKVTEPSSMSRLECVTVTECHTVFTTHSPRFHF